MVARGYVDVALTQYHLISYWTRIFLNHLSQYSLQGGAVFVNRVWSSLIRCVRVL
jgi:hypothetical protein